MASHSHFTRKSAKDKGITLGNIRNYLLDEWQNKPNIETTGSIDNLQTVKDNLRTELKFPKASSSESNSPDIDTFDLKVEVEQVKKIVRSNI